MAMLKKIVATLLITVGALLATIEPVVAKEAGSFDQQKGYEVLALINEYRTENGLSVVQYADGLQDKVDVRSTEIEHCSVVGKHEHRMKDGTWSPVWDADYVHPNTELAENLAWGYDSEEDIVEQWKLSPGHNANMLMPNMTKGAVSFYTDKYGRTYCSLWLESGN